MRRSSISSAATASPSPPATPDTPSSFVGSDYAFRTYFTRAMAEGTAQQYALGTVSGRPGLYLSRRVDSVIGPLGVVVVKVEFDELEARWRESGLVVQVTDADGVVLATTDPAWRFGTTRPLADEAAARAALQLGGTPLAPRCRSARGRTAARGSTARPTSSRRRRGRPVGAGLAARGVPAAEPALATAARSAQVTTLLAGLLLALGGLAMLRRRRWALARQAALAAMNARARAPRRAAHRGAQPLQHGARRRDRRARGGRDPGAAAARRPRPGQPAVDPRPGGRRGRARDQPAAGGDPRLCRDRRPAARRRPGRRGARQSARDRRRHRADRRDHPGAARLRPPRRRRDPAGRGRGGASTARWRCSPAASATPASTIVRAPRAAGVDGDRRPHPAGADPRQPAAERARRGARHARPGDRDRRRGRAGRSWSRSRQRPRHPAGGARPALHAVHHHQGDGPRPRPRHLGRPRPRVRRRARGSSPAGGAGAAFTLELPRAA